MGIPAPDPDQRPDLTSVDVQMGDTISVSTGGWFNVPTSFYYQWYREVPDGVFEIAGATGETYTIQSDDCAGFVYCLIRGENAAGTSEPAISTFTNGIPLPEQADVRGCGYPYLVGVYRKTLNVVGGKNTYEFKVGGAPQGLIQWNAFEARWEMSDTSGYSEGMLYYSFGGPDPWTFGWGLDNDDLSPPPAVTQV